MQKLLLISALLIASLASYAADLPNILWISNEDHGPHLGAYGDTYATTPNLDAFAKRAFRYDKASSNVPVCAPRQNYDYFGDVPTVDGKSPYAFQGPRSVIHEVLSKLPSGSRILYGK